MVIAKFGGSSLCNADGFRRVMAIVRKNSIPLVIVSAPGGKTKTTDLLIAAYAKWKRSGKVEGEIFDAIKQRFVNIATAFNVKIDTFLADVCAAINAGCGYDYAVSRGENICAKILAKALGYNFVDAKECVKLTMDGKIDVKSTKAHTGNIKLPCVIPGFYGFIPSGEIKLLPRGGSDISGAALAAAMGCEYQKWTDVDGIYDGRGGVIDSLSYDEAELLCYFGATVMHYESMRLLKDSGVKLTIKNTFSQAKGTVISQKKCDAFAVSSKKMFLGDERADVSAITGAGLKIPFTSSLLGKSKILIDGCDFSDLALKRILSYDGINAVNATAAIGNVPHDFMPDKLLYKGEIGGIYVSKLE